MKQHINLLTFPDQQRLTSELALHITKLLASAIQKNEKASLAVSGGATPVALFKSLSTIDIAWQNVDITLVDERWVAPTHADSNENLVRTHLLQNRAATAEFTGMKNSAPTASEGEHECKKQLEKIPRPFDVLILGLGTDGHTASLFPGAAKLHQATDMHSGKKCIGIAPLSASHERMTLTLPEILNSKHIFLHITGQIKKEVLDQALQDGPAEEMPIRFILRHLKHEQKLPQQNSMSIYWAQ